MRSITRLWRWVPLALLAAASIAHGEADQYLSRDGNVSGGSVYPGSDGAVIAAEPADSPWETFVEGEEPPPDRFELPGFWPILQTSPELQTFVAGPTFRNQANRIEVGTGLGYINNRWRFPFELSVEPTWRRNKNAPANDRNFARVRTFGLVELWNRSSDWEATFVSGTAFWQIQSSSFNELELGGSMSEVIGRRLALSANLVWAGSWPHGDDFNNAAIFSMGTSYNFGAGVRAGGFYEPHQNISGEDDWGGFVSYQFLPFAELNVNAGKHDFVLARLMISYALERP